MHLVQPALTGFDPAELPLTKDYAVGVMPEKPHRFPHPAGARSTHWRGGCARRGLLRRLLLVIGIVLLGLHDLPH